MDTISATATTASSVLGAAVEYIPNGLYAVFPPVISLICWILVLNLGFCKPINRLCKYFGVKLSKDNQCDVFWTLATFIGPSAQFSWLLVTNAEPDLTFRGGEPVDPGTPELTWPVKVYTSLIVCFVVGHSVAAIFAAVNTAFEVWSMRRNPKGEAGDPKKEC